MDAMGIAPAGVGTEVEALFRQALEGLTEPKVLELGTKRQHGVPTHHAAWLPAGATHVMSDIEDGEDVDVVADAHDLAPFDDGSFDVFIAVSTWEHLARPWIAAEQAARVLRPGGLVYVATHQTFPIHGYPSDYFRFSDEAMKVLFGPPLFSQQWASYQFPSQIIPPPEVTRWNTAAPNYLNVDCFAIRAEGREDVQLQKGPQRVRRAGR